MYGWISVDVQVICGAYQAFGETSKAIFPLLKNNSEQVTTFFCHRNLVESLNEVYHPETDVLWIEPIVYLGW